MKIRTIFLLTLFLPLCMMAQDKEQQPKEQKKENVRGTTPEMRGGGPLGTHVTPGNIYVDDAFGNYGALYISDAGGTLYLGGASTDDVYIKDFNSGSVIIGTGGGTTNIGNTLNVDSSTGNTTIGNTVNVISATSQVGIGMDPTGTSAVGTKLDVLSTDPAATFESAAINGVYDVAGTFVDNAAVQGTNNTRPFYGYGVKGYGGYRGVAGYYDHSTFGDAGTGYGIYGRSLNDSSTAYGSYGYASSNSGTTYGVYGTTDTGTGNNYAGYFSGDVTVTGTFTNPSDSKLKKDISSLRSSGVLNKLMSLGTYTYFYDNAKYPHMNLPKTQQYGYIAQEVQEAFPNLVKQNVQEVDEKQSDAERVEFLGVNILGMVPILTTAIQEQQAIIDKQQAQIDALIERVEALEK